MVKYVSIDGEFVSKEWFALLSDIRHKDGVNFNVNEGHRTMARQIYFYQLYRSGRGPIAAVPSPFAPHIRTGRFDHAVDFTNAEGVRQAAARRGVTLTRTVLWSNGTVREEWHLEANAAQLKAYYKKHQGPRTLKFGSRGEDVQHLQVLLRELGYLKVKKARKVFGIKTRRALKRFQKTRGLKSDGIYGPHTRRILERAYSRRTK